jgi:hypothetical protein
VPRLLAFLPCERAIINRDDDSVSLITVMQSLSAFIPDALRGEKNGLLPLRWAMFSYWLKESEDEGVSFDQRIEVVSPDGDALVGQDSQFVIVKNTHSQIATIFGLPVKVLQDGAIAYRLRLSWRRSDTSTFTVAFEYPLTVLVSFGDPVHANQ